jgi:putative ABC transport system permease protein
MGIKLGDIIEFDIQGVEIKGKVVNFRKIKWASFQPNFFISFAAGVLDDAPKTSIGIVNGLKRHRSRVDYFHKLPKPYPMYQSSMFGS